MPFGMTPFLLQMLRDPNDGSRLGVKHPRYDKKGHISDCILVGKSGATYPVRKGIPRFTGERQKIRTVVSDKEQHTEAHKNLYKHAWLNEFVKHTFGGEDVFKDKVVMDCGGGSGYQGLWMLQNGAKHVIHLENSRAVDGVVRECMEDSPFIDIVQCTLDGLPFEPESFEGLIICNDALRHSPSFDHSLKSLWSILSSCGEIVFQCPLRQDKYWYHHLRHKMIHINLRRFMSNRSNWFVSLYAKILAFLNLLPGVNYILLKNQLVYRTTKPNGHFCLKRRYKDAMHHTFEYFAGYKYQHIKTQDELRNLAYFLQKNPCYINNLEDICCQDRPVGMALRIKKKA
jgi:SAM-dependent methyltransferase